MIYDKSLLDFDERMIFERSDECECVVALKWEKKKEEDEEETSASRRGRMETELFPFSLFELNERRKTLSSGPGESAHRE